MSNLSNMKVEPCDNGYMFIAAVMEPFKQICNEDTGECFTDKTEVRNVLISVIENFNKANPHFAIEVKDK